MASGKIVMQNENTGAIKDAPIGFSWTVLFFGPIPALFRGDWPGFFIMLLCYVITASFSAWYFLFTYNKQFVKRLVGEGYKVKFTPMPIDMISAQIGVALEMVEDDKK